MATEWEVPMAACRSTASVAASLILPPNQNDSFMVAAAGDQFASFCGQDFFSALGSCNSSFYSAPEKSADAGSSLLSSAFQVEQSSFDLYIPQCEDEAELEWLSRFMEESSFSDVEPAPPPPSCAAEKLDAGYGARSKRPRAAPWSSLAMNSPSSSSSSSSSEFSSDGAGRTKKGRVDSPRRCTHCASETTPQWRTGPLGPKTLCNACGVRYKSGRLVPEYRPAASPTFVLTQHSNSHRKVMELRRHKELLLSLRHPQSNQDPSSAPRTEILFDDGAAACRTAGGI